MSFDKLGWVAAVVIAIIALLMNYNDMKSDLPPPGQTEFPAQWKGKVKLGLLIANDASGKVFVVDGNGDEIRSCKTCTPGLSKKYGPGCKSAPKDLNVCGPIKSVVPIENRTITILHGYGSDCWFVYPSGDELVGYPAGCTI